ncbi:MAG: hypothetical protein SXG53_22135 [Pseudomonadota bacterium]|nr:hypothetical protein [Pseudomonadota bacterium]
MPDIPTVKFDTSYLTQGVLEALERDIRELPETNDRNFDEIYDIAVRAIATGGDLHSLSVELAVRSGVTMTSQRAAKVSTLLWLRTRNRIDQIRATELGLTHAIWMYSNAPCMEDPKAPSEKDLRRDAAHKAADGKHYRITEGLRVGGRRIWPGDEDGCRCVSRTVVPGFED